MDERSRRGAAAHRAGLVAEDAAAWMAERRGLTVLERRHRTPHGEIDLIARASDGTLVFVEVKSRRSRDEAAHALTPRQWRRLEAAALHYAAVNVESTPSVDAVRQSAPPDMRFDVVLVDRAGRTEWMENAARFDEW